MLNRCVISAQALPVWTELTHGVEPDQKHLQIKTIADQGFTLVRDTQSLEQLKAQNQSCSVAPESFNLSNCLIQSMTFRRDGAQWIIKHEPLTMK